MMLLQLRLLWFMRALAVLSIWAMWVDLIYRSMFYRGELIRQARDYDSRKARGEI